MDGKSVGGGYILEDRMLGGRPNGWYAGRNKKYYDMFNLTAEKEFAYIFDDENVAKQKADFLNRNGWNFAVVEVERKSQEE